MTELRDLPNIGPHALRCLAMIGIRTPAELAATGSAAACARIARADGDPPCRSMLAALEGAIRGIRWHAIPKEERETLWQEYQSMLHNDDESGATA